MATDTIKIFSNKAFRFDHPEDKSLSVTVRARDFNEIPEWAKESAMYKLADKDGDVMEIVTKEDEKAAQISGARKRNRGQTAGSNASDSGDNGSASTGNETEQTQTV